MFYQEQTNENGTDSFLYFTNSKGESNHTGYRKTWYVYLPNVFERNRVENETWNMGFEDPIIKCSCVTNTGENVIKIGPYVFVKKKKKHK